MTFSRWGLFAGCLAAMGAASMPEILPETAGVAVRGAPVMAVIDGLPQAPSAVSVVLPGRPAVLGAAADRRQAAIARDVLYGRPEHLTLSPVAPSVLNRIDVDPETRALGALKSRLSATEFRIQRELYLSHFFFEPGEQLVDNAVSKDSRLRPSARFDQRGERPFDGYLKARRRLFARAFDEITLDDLNQAHEDLMSSRSVRASRLPPGIEPANSEGTETADLGVIRDCSVLNEEVIKKSAVIRPALSAASKSPGALRNAKIVSRNDLLTADRTGKIEFTSLTNWRSFASRLSAETARLLASKPFNRLDDNSISIRRLRRRVLSELTERAWDDMKIALSLARTREESIAVVADFYYEFVSVHPYVNGNGRLGRLLAERILRERGIPPPIWSNIEEDVFHTRRDFRARFQKAVALSEVYHRDLAAVIAVGGAVDSVATPYWGSRGGRRALELAWPDQFLAWVGSSRLNAATKNLDTGKLAERFIVWCRDWVYLAYLTDRVRLATPHFVRTFNVPSATAASHELKMGLYYEPRTTLYRGESWTKTFTDAEIIKSALRMDGPLLGMGLKADTPPAKFERLFASFNRKMARAPDQFSRATYEHSRTLASYWTNGYASFTADMKIADDFRNGFLMGAAHNNRLKSRVMVGVADRKVASLRTATELFGFQTDLWGVPRERETLLAGGADPESVRFIEVDDVEVIQKLPDVEEMVHQTEEGNSRSLRIIRRRILRRHGHDLISLAYLDGAGNLSSVAWYRIRLKPSQGGSTRVVAQRVSESEVPKRFRNLRAYLTRGNDETSA